MKSSPWLGASLCPPQATGPCVALSAPLFPQPEYPFTSPFSPVLPVVQTAFQGLSTAVKLSLNTLILKDSLSLKPQCCLGHFERLYYVIFITFPLVGCILSRWQHGCGGQSHCIQETETEFGCCGRSQGLGTGQVTGTWPGEGKCIASDISRGASPKGSGVQRPRGHGQR